MPRSRAASSIAILSYLFVLIVLLLDGCSQLDSGQQIGSGMSQPARAIDEANRGQESGRIAVVPVGCSIGRDWVAIEATFEGPKRITELFALALADAVRASPDQWVEIRGPTGEPLEYKARRATSARIQYVHPKTTAAYQVTGQGVRFTYWLGARTKQEPPDGTYTYRLRADAPYLRVLPEIVRTDLLSDVQVESQEYQSHVAKLLAPQSGIGTIIGQRP